MYKDVLIQCLKSLPISRGKIIVDVSDIKEIDGHGWDYTLTYRLYNNPDGMNEVSFHNWITTETYNTFADEYLANEANRNKKLEEIRLAREEMDKARKEHDEFINLISTEVDGIKQINITTENFEEYQRDQRNMKEKYEAYVQKVREFQ